MTLSARELTLNQLETTKFQIEKVLEGLPESLYEAKLSPEAMSPRLTLAHFLEIFEAISKQLQGETHKWGSYLSNHKDYRSLLKQYTSERALSIAAAIEGGKDENLTVLFNYIGQLCLLRMEQDPSFDPVSIYSK